MAALPEGRVREGVGQAHRERDDEGGALTRHAAGHDLALVALDDSIVRGTTLKTSILSILARTNPRKIVIASTAPQIRYPDCYGIDMSQLGKFIAFQAAMRLLAKKRKRRLIDDPAPGRVDHDAGVGEAGELRGADRPGGLVGETGMDHERLGPVAQLVKAVGPLDA